MSADGDLEGYAVARWPTLVRTLVLLGAPPAQAVSLAVQAVARLREEPVEGWVDADALVLGEIWAQWQEDRTPWWDDGGLGSLADLDGSGFEEIEPALDALAPAARARLVLEAVGGLAPEQGEQVVGPAPGAGLAPEPLRFVAEAIPVAPVPTDRIADTGRVRRRRRAGAVVAVVAVLGLGAAALTPTVRQALREPSDPPPGSEGTDAIVVQPPEVPVTVVEVRGPPSAAFSVGGRVHLPSGPVDVDGQIVALTTPEARSLGVVVATGDRLVRHVRPDGRTVSVGAVADDTVPVSSSSDATVGWVEGSDNRFLRVYDLATSSTRALVPVPPEARLVGLVDGTAYLDTAAGTLVLGQAPQTRTLPGPAVLDVVGGVRVLDAGESALSVESGRRETLVVAGAEPRLSDNGRYLLARTPDGFGFVVVDVDRARPVDLALPGDADVVDAAIGNASVTLVVRRGGQQSVPGDDSPGASSPVYDLVWCSLDAFGCRVDVRVVGADSPPRLAR